MLQSTIKSKTQSLVANLFDGIITECNTAIKLINKDPDHYIIRAYPFEIIRKNGLPVEREVLIALKEHFSDLT